MKRLILIIVFAGASLGYFLIYSRDPKSSFSLTSTSFTNKGWIPAKYTCSGENVSPQLHWDTKDLKKVESYVLIVDDPDARKVVGKRFVHWIVCLPPEVTTLDDSISGKSNSSLLALNPKIKVLRNDHGQTNYKGPCPPPHEEHDYHFTVFAMQNNIEDVIKKCAHKAPFNSKIFRTLMAKDIIGHAVLIGKYKRNK